MKTSVFPGRYVQGPGVLARLGEETLRLGTLALALMDDTLPGPIARAVAGGGGCVRLHPVTPRCTLDAIAAAETAVAASGADVVVAVGGGKTIDLGRATADRLRLPFISVPTVAATDAPCSGLSVIYDERDRVVEDRFMRRNPDTVLVDSAVVCAAPHRFFAAGIGDALATFHEAEACRRSGAGNMCGGQGTLLAFAAAGLCHDTLVAHGAQALADCRDGQVTEAFEKVLEANVLLSGIGFESGGVAAAHAFHHGIADIPESHGALHGEKVAFGVLAELALTGRDDAEIAGVARFNRSVGLPVTLAELGIRDPRDACPRIAARAARAGEIIHNEPMTVTPALAEAALFRADAIGASV